MSERVFSLGVLPPLAGRLSERPEGALGGQVPLRCYLRLAAVLPTSRCGVTYVSLRCYLRLAAVLPTSRGVTYVSRCYIRLAAVLPTSRCGVTYVSLAGLACAPPSQGGPPPPPRGSPLGAQGPIGGLAGDVAAVQGAPRGGAGVCVRQGLRHWGARPAAQARVGGEHGPELAAVQSAVDAKGVRRALRGPRGERARQPLQGRRGAHHQGNAWSLLVTMGHAWSLEHVYNWSRRYTIPH
eukprot:1188202-Prorocentrum_minimum.AAC.2